MIGNVAFCLAFGPAFIKAMQRFETRLHVRWVPIAAAVLPALLLFPAMALAKTPTAYLESAQNADGGFGGAPGQASADLYTGWAALGLEAAGRHPADVGKLPDGAQSNAQGGGTPARRPARSSPWPPPASRRATSSRSSSGPARAARSPAASTRPRSRSSR